MRALKTLLALVAFTVFYGCAEPRIIPKNQLVLSSELQALCNTQTKSILRGEEEAFDVVQKIIINSGPHNSQKRSFCVDAPDTVASQSGHVRDG